MREFTEWESQLIFRALMLLSFIIDNRESQKCMELADYFRSNAVANKMMAEDEKYEYKPGTGT